MSYQMEWFEVSRLASGALLRLPIFHLMGQEGGPHLGVVATIHGDEIVGIEVIRRLLAQLANTPLRGHLHCLPVANPLAFETLTRNTPLAVEIANLNRAFPGDPHGDLVAQLAHAIADRFLARVTHLVDLHAGGSHPIVDYTISLRDLDLALAFGQRVVRPVEGYAGTLGALAAAQGKPALVAEIGGGYLMDESYITLGVRGVLNVMRYLGMLPGSPERTGEQIVVRDVLTLRPHHGGLLYSALDPAMMGQVVPRGHVMGRVVDPYTFEERESLQAPFSRSIILLLRSGITRVNPGDYAYMVGDLDGAEIARTPT